MKTVIPCRKGSSYLGGKTHVSTTFPDASLTLSELLQIQKCKLNTFYSIEEEQPNELDVENDNVKSSETHRPIYDNELSTETHITGDDILSNQNADMSDNNGNEKIISDLQSSEYSHVSRVARPLHTLSECHKRCSQAPTRSVSISSKPMSFSEEDLQQQEEIRANRCQSEIKSGHLVFIVSDLNLGSVLPSSKCCRQGNSRTPLPSRFPVIVKIHRKSCEHYAIISLTRRRQTLPSFFLKLKRSRVMRSSTNPAHFVVIVDGAEGKSYKFEASNPDAASEWIQAFSSDSSQCQTSLYDRQLSGCSDSSTVSSASSGNEVQKERCSETVGALVSEINAPSPSLKLPTSPFLPVLSESCDEEEEDEY